uniref:Uncharacterized protein n=1 Tax=uncultured alpha proteobacterium HF0010_30A23 TaxID=710802 RepID=E0XRL9_9PROT|nr:hypothetical protein [uncultured alpha proteobacterium HF0010_30A23]
MHLPTLKASASSDHIQPNKPKTQRQPRILSFCLNQQCQRTNPPRVWLQKSVPCAGSERGLRPCLSLVKGQYQKPQGVFEGADRTHLQGLTNPRTTCVHQNIMRAISGIFGV